jgi:hypothetical protein
VRVAVRLLVSMCLCILVGSTSGFVSHASALSEDRAYEMVTPPFKGGYGAFLQAAGLDGDGVVFASLGVFAGIPNATFLGNTYLARRNSKTGWSTTLVQPPFLAELADFSSNLGYTLTAKNGENEDETEFVLHGNDLPDTAEMWEPFNGVAMRRQNGEVTITVELAADANLCHLVLHGYELLPEVPSGPYFQLYDYGRACGGEGLPWFRLVAVKNSPGSNGEALLIKPECPEDLGLSHDGYNTGAFGAQQHANFNAISEDGREIFFTVDAREGTHAACSGTQVPQLFMRVGGVRTVEVSRPVDPAKPFGGCGEGGGAGETPGEVPCAGASSRSPAFFKGASEDGSRVFFTTAARLVESDTDSTSKLYMARIGCPPGEPGCDAAEKRVTGLTDVSKSSVAGEGGDVQGVVSVGASGERVYFVAAGVLTRAPNGEGLIAERGADNLYVYDAGTEAVSFIDDLCSGPGETGPGEAGARVEDARCPRSPVGGSDDTRLWGDNGEAQSTADGRFLVFSTVAQLIDHGTQADIDNGRDVYRYDTETGELNRISLGEYGHDSNGNGEGYDATIPSVGVAPGGSGGSLDIQQHEMGLRAVSDDGRRVVFMATEPLSVDAANGHDDVYIWEKTSGGDEGRVSLISSGSSVTNDLAPVLTPSGRDVFFDTTAGLVAADTENDTDVYDARIEGGFPEPPAPGAECSADGCQGPLTNPVPLLIPGSAAQPPESSSPSVKTKAKAHRRAARRKRKKARRKRAHGSRGAR